MAYGNRNPNLHRTELPNLRFRLITVQVSVSVESGFRTPGQNTEGTSNYHLCAFQIDRQNCSDIDRFPRLRCGFCPPIARKNNEAHRVVPLDGRAIHRTIFPVGVCGGVGNTSGQLRPGSEATGSGALRGSSGYSWCRLGTPGRPCGDGSLNGGGGYQSERRLPGVNRTLADEYLDTCDGELYFLVRPELAIPK